MSQRLQTKDFNYNLPKKCIALKPVSPRDHSKLLVLNKKNKNIKHDYFYNILKYLPKNCVLVLNKSKVIPAKLYCKIESSKCEILLEKKISKNSFQVFVKPGKKFKINKTVKFSKNLTAIVQKIYSDGTRKLVFNLEKQELDSEIEKIGKAPFPPYIKNSPASFEDYQTVYAKTKGSIAAPTAGLHFTKDLLKKIKKADINIAYITLHVGRGTFQPIKSKNILEHKMHSEWITISKRTAALLNEAKEEGKKIIAVGTTSVRALESASIAKNLITEYSKKSSLYIYPGYKFKFIDGMITNFHLPKSTLLLLISTLAGKNLIFKAYHEAIKKNYRFYSFGDAMLIL